MGEATAERAGERSGKLPPPPSRRRRRDQVMLMAMTSRRLERGFSLIELLVVIAVVAVLLSLLLPALAGARTQARIAMCGSRLQQLGVATTLYLGDFKNALPQTVVELPEGGQRVSGLLFGGKKGRLPLCGVDSVGPERRPLNAYVHLGPVPPDSEQTTFEMEPYRSPMDKGAEEMYLPLPEFSHPDSIYQLMGTSYVVNDHGLDGDYYPTLIPEGGGGMPVVADATKTWMIGSHTIYNYQQDSDRGERWYSPGLAQANLLFVDTHVRLVLPIPDVFCQVENTTPDYTFLPVPGHIAH